MGANLYTAAAYMAVITGTALSFFVVHGSWSNLPRRYFAIVTQVAAIWCLFPIAAAVHVSEDLRHLLVRLTYIAGAFTPTGVLHFVLVVTPRQRTLARKVFLALCYLGSILFVPVIFHPDFMVGVLTYQPHFSPVPGSLFKYFIAFYLAVCVGAFIILLIDYRHATPEKKNQLLYIILAFGIAIFSPLLHFGGYYLKSEPLPHDFLFVTYSSIIAYAIVRHQLLDIEVVIKRTLQFAGLVGSVVAVVSLVAFVSQDLLSRFITIPKWLSNVMAAAIIAVLYEPLRNWLTNVTERYLFQKRYDYKALLKKFTDEIMVILDLRRVAEMTVNTFTETVKLDGASLLLLNKDTRKYEVAFSRGGSSKAGMVDEQEPFIMFLRETHEPIGQDGELGKVRFPDEVRNRLKELNARLCLPLNVHEDLIGALCLGKKKSDEEFTKDDLDILIPLSRTLALAISNAQVVEELKVTQAQAAQKEKLAVIGTLSAGINHEICNPLGIVKAQCEAFLLDQEDGILVGKSAQELSERMGNILRVALKQIDRATAITQKLSNFAKPIKEAAAQPVAIDHEIDEVLLLVGHDLKLEKIEVTKEIESGLPPIIVDRRQLQEVLFNLIRNAGQAIVAPGKIWVRAKLLAGDTVRIEIEDTGSGIPPDKLGKIYDPFFTTKEPGKGTGLGLFIVRQIIERNKGRITVESTVGKGTTFALEFPAAKSAAVARV